MRITFSLDPACQDLDAIHGMLAATYWSPNIRREVVAEAMRNSITAVAIDDATGATVGLARVVTDRATFAWLCDVVVDERFRGQGLSRRMIEELERLPSLQTVRRWALATRDAEGLYEKFGYRPDLVTFAKAVTSGYIPLGGVMVGDRVAQVLIDKGGEFNHGYTYSGHPVACAVALANLEIMEREGLPQRVRDDVGPYLAKRFVELNDHPLVGVAETCGFVAGLVLVKDKATRQVFDPDLAVGMMCRAHCFKNGLIMRAVGDRMIIAPPLVMTHEQIDDMMALIRLCLDATLTQLRSLGHVA